jgi:hypothetical protein
MVALAEPVDAPVVIRRRRIELADGSRRGAVQPYHKAANMPVDEAESYLNTCSEASAALARGNLGEVFATLSDYRLERACVLQASGRPLPVLAAILASHALIHTAEGEFFRAALRGACESWGLTVCGWKERDMPAVAAQMLHRSAEELQGALAKLGKTVGPPWRQDEKLAALGAWVALAGKPDA